MFLGLGSRRVEDVPDDTEIWVVNEANTVLPDGRMAARVFQMHPRNWREAERRFLRNRMPRNCFGRGPDHVEYLRTCGVPVYGQQVWDDIPTSVRYPFETVTEAVGIPLPPSGVKRLWAASTWGYMAALLIAESLYGHSALELSLSGAELVDGTPRERAWEWPNLAYYLGVLVARGAVLRLPEAGTSLLSSPHYALGGNPKVYHPDHWWMPGRGVVAIDEVGAYYWGPARGYE